MTRGLAWIVLAAFLFSPGSLFAQEDDEPAISITSPDTASTFAYGTIKSHGLIWDRKKKMLVARVTFTDTEQDMDPPPEDTHDFRLPGVILDAARGLFTAATAQGEIIPIARIRKTFFLEWIEPLPNAHIRVLHPRGNVSVVLEAVRPAAPASIKSHNVSYIK